MATRFSSLPPSIAQDYMRDPRLLHAQNVMQAGADTSPVYTPVQGLARALQGLVGGYQRRKVGEEYKDRATAYQKTLADVLGARRTLPVESDAPESGGITGDLRISEMARFLAQNPDTAALGFQLQMQDVLAGSQFDRQRRLAAEKLKLEAPKSRTVKRGGLEVTEQWNPATRTWEAVGESGIGVISPEAVGQKQEIAAAGRPQNIGTIPPGYQLVTTPEGAQQMVPIPGSPAEAKAKEAEIQAGQRTEQKERQADVVLQDIDRAIEVMDKAILPTTGLAGDLLSGVGGTASRDLKGLVDTIKANVGFDKLQQMREASPTGGALGQVSELENRLLQSVLGNLEQSQSEGQVRFNLNRLYNTYLDIVHGPGDGPKRRPLTQGQKKEDGGIKFLGFE